VIISDTNKDAINNTVHFTPLRFVETLNALNSRAIPQTNIMNVIIPNTANSEISENVNSLFINLVILKDAIVLPIVKLHSAINKRGYFAKITVPAIS